MSRAIVWPLNSSRALPDHLSLAREHLARAVADDPELRRLLDAVKQRELDPLTAVREIVERVFRLPSS